MGVRSLDFLSELDVDEKGCDESQYEKGDLVWVKLGVKKENEWIGLGGDVCQGLIGGEHDEDG